MWFVSVIESLRVVDGRWVKLIYFVASRSEKKKFYYLVGITDRYIISFVALFNVLYFWPVLGDVPGPGKFRCTKNTEVECVKAGEALRAADKPDYSSTGSK